MRLFVQSLVHQYGGVLVVAVSSSYHGEYWYLSLQNGAQVDIKLFKTWEACDDMFMRAIGLMSWNGDGGWALHREPRTMAVMPPSYITEAYGFWVQQALTPVHVRVLADTMPCVAAGASM